MKCLIKIDSRSTIDVRLYFVFSLIKNSEKLTNLVKTSSLGIRLLFKNSSINKSFMQL